MAGLLLICTQQWQRTSLPAPMACATRCTAGRASPASAADRACNRHEAAAPLDGATSPATSAMLQHLPHGCLMLAGLPAPPVAAAAGITTHSRAGCEAAWRCGSHILVPVQRLQQPRQPRLQAQPRLGQHTGQQHPELVQRQRLQAWGNASGACGAPMRRLCERRRHVPAKDEVRVRQSLLMWRCGRPTLLRSVSALINASAACNAARAGGQRHRRPAVVHDARLGTPACRLHMRSCTLTALAADSAPCSGASMWNRCCSSWKLMELRATMCPPGERGRRCQRQDRCMVPGIDRGLMRPRDAAARQRGPSTARAVPSLVCIMVKRAEQGFQLRLRAALFHPGGRCVDDYKR